MQKVIVASLVLMLMSSVVWSQIINIPDLNFKNALLNTNCADFNGDGNFTSQVDLNNDDEIQLSEVLGVQGLNLTNQNIVSIAGIENFVNLTYLNIQFNAVENMDISSLSNLTRLLCDSNELTMLDVSNNLNLEGLFCSDNNLSEIDITQNTELKNFECFINQLTEIDVNSNPNLETLNCSVNQISDLDVTNNPLLVWLLASNMNLTDLDITNNTFLETLNVGNNSLTQIDLSQNSGLFSVTINGNLLTDIDISQNPSIDNLNVEFNNLITANIKNGTSMMIYDGLGYNPNIDFVCADDFEIASVQSVFDAFNYTEAMVSDDCNLSVHESEIASQIQVFPNPFSNQLFIKSSALIEYVAIYEMKGQQVLNESTLGLNSSLDVSKLVSGCYILKIQTSKTTEIKTIIKQ